MTSPAQKPIRIAPLSASPAVTSALSEILIEAVANGGSVSFMHPLSREAAAKFWQGSLASAERGERIVLGAFDGEALVGTANGIVTADAKAAFERAVALDAQDVKGRYFLGLAAEQDGHRADAVSIWRAMLTGAPEGAPWAGFVRGELARLEGGPGGPGPDDLAAASDMGPEQRMTMIRGMVEKLSDRLHHDGTDLEGWLRLVRSYMVLGERDKAQAAAGEARHALASDPEKLRRINELVKGLGLEG